jgi:hypothetical protein
LKQQADHLQVTSEALRYSSQEECQQMLQEQTVTFQKINAEKQRLQGGILELQRDLGALEKHSCTTSSTEVSEEMQLEEEVHARAQEQKQRKELQMLNEAEAFYSHMSQTVAATAGYSVDRFSKDGLVLKIRMVDLDECSSHPLDNSSASKDITEVGCTPRQKRVRTAGTDASTDSSDGGIDRGGAQDDDEDNTGIASKVAEKALEGAQSHTESGGDLDSGSGGKAGPWIKTSDAYELRITFKPNSSVLEDVQLSPSGAAPIADIIEAALCRANDDDGGLRFLLREVRARLRNHSVLAQHLQELRASYHTTFKCMDGGDGMSGGMTEVVFSVAVGVAVSAEISPDYPQTYAPIRLMRFDGVNGWSKAELEALRSEMNNGNRQLRLHLPSLARELQARLEQIDKTSTPTQILKGRVQLGSDTVTQQNLKRSRDGSPKPQ